MLSRRRVNESRFAIAALVVSAAFASCRPTPGAPSESVGAIRGRSSAEAIPGGQARPEREVRGLSPSVRTVTSELYYATHPLAGPKAGTPGLEFAGSSRVEFDRQGYITRADSYGPDGKATGTVEYSRDQRGFLIRERSWGADGSLGYDLSYEYDGRGRLLKESYRDASGADGGGYAYEYGDSDRPARREAFRPGNSPSDGRQYLDYVYDGTGRLVEERHYFETMGGVVLSVRHAYRDGRLAYSSHYDRGGWLEFRVFFEYDMRGDLSLEEGYQLPMTADPANYEGIDDRRLSPPEFLISVRQYGYHYYE